MIGIVGSDKLITSVTSSFEISDDCPYTEEDRLDIMCNAFDDVLSGLGGARAKQAVPALISCLAANPNQESAIWALGDIGDPQAGPAIFSTLNIKDTDGDGRKIHALAQLNYSPLVPVLINRIETKLENGKPGTEIYADDEMNAIDLMRDRRGIPVLKKWLANPDTQDKEIAKRGLATLSDDPTAELLKLLEPASENERLQIIDDLRRYNEPKVIEKLAEIGRTSPEGAARGWSFWSLASIGTRKSLLALADLGNADYSHIKKPWGLDASTEIYTGEIADSLRKATGQDFGQDFGAWKKWLSDPLHAIPKAQWAKH